MATRRLSSLVSLSIFFRDFFRTVDFAIRMGDAFETADVSVRTVHVAIRMVGASVRTVHVAIQTDSNGRLNSSISRSNGLLKKANVLCSRSNGMFSHSNSYRTVCKRLFRTVLKSVKVRFPRAGHI